MLAGVGEWGAPDYSFWIVIVVVITTIVVNTPASHPVLIYYGQQIPTYKQTLLMLIHKESNVLHKPSSLSITAVVKPHNTTTIPWHFTCL